MQQGSMYINRGKTVHDLKIKNEHYELTEMSTTKAETFVCR